MEERRNRSQKPPLDTSKEHSVPASAGRVCLTRARCDGMGIRFGRKPKLTAFQIKEALERQQADFTFDLRQ